MENEPAEKIATETGEAVAEAIEPIVEAAQAVEIEAQAAAESAVEEAEARAEAAEETAEMIAAAALENEKIRRIETMEQEHSEWRAEREIHNQRVATLETSIAELSAKIESLKLLIQPPPSPPAESSLQSPTISSPEGAVARPVPVAEESKPARKRRFI